MQIILVRHGQTQWNQVERFRGHTDVPLNDIGLAQAEATAKRIATLWHPQAIYASPLSRAMVTAQKIAAVTGLTAQPSSGLMDIYFGDWQGLSPAEAQLRWPEQISIWLHTPQNVVIPGGDTFSEVQNRALKLISNLLDENPDQTVVLVSHTVVLRLMLLGILGLGFDHFWTLRQDNCAISVLDATKDRIVLISMNDTCHLQQILK